MIKNIVFDMGNVLVHYDSDLLLKDYPDTDKTVLKREIYQSVDWVLLDRGRLTEQQLTERVQNRLPHGLRDAAARLIKWYELTSPVEGMEELIKKLHENGYKIYLLSNTSLAFHEFRKNIDVLKYFDGTFISADCGLLKPDHRIFDMFCKHFRLDPAQCMFIDDSPANVESAIDTGFEGTVFHNDVKLLAEQLRNKGITIEL